MRIAEKKKSQITALYEQCSNLPADVRSCLENGYFTVTVPPPWNMSNQKTAQEVQDKIKEWSRQYTGVVCYCFDSLPLLSCRLVFSSSKSLGLIKPSPVTTSLSL